MDPAVEHKNRPRVTPISLLEAKVRAGEQQARAMLERLEQAMVRCGYLRDGIYNSRQAGFTGRNDRGTVLLWRGGKILLGRGLSKQEDGSLAKRKGDGSYVANDPVGVRGMKVRDLVTVACHLAPFVDALEGQSRHLADELARACETIERIMGRIESAPLPSDEPAQMSVDELAGD